MDVKAAAGRAMFVFGLAASVAAAGAARARTGTDGSTPGAISAGQMHSVCRLEWTLADANSDGAITEDEAQGDLRDQFASVDADGDGTISAREYEACSRAR